MRQAIALLISVALGLLAVFAMRNQMAQETSQGQTAEERVAVLFAKRLLLEQSDVKKSDTMIKLLPISAVTDDMVKPHELVEIQEKSLSREVNREGPLFHSDFIAGGKAKSVGLQPGRRLVSIPVNQINGVSGLIRPGHRIDLLYSTTHSKRSESGSSTSVLLENVHVHAIDSQTVDLGARTNRKGSYSTITLNVSPEEAPLLVAASRSGQITCTLRSTKDMDPGRVQGDVKPADIEALARRLNQKRWQGQR